MLVQRWVMELLSCVDHSRELCDSCAEIWVVTKDTTKCACFCWLDK
ncbi:unnamed protein product [Arabidopsis thaliana]|uniref:(thale cress) hypothetical protein n=1 Tax=Arabidopsis thaliana TaxID=3702 RepID=A0A7G2E968_ARATH|nr:unnamed protein product [Arabidopsis thaliana]